MPKNTFRAGDFTPTKFSSAEDKAKFANALVRFIEGGFQEKSFSQGLYDRLSSCFHHIAHGNRDGFYAAWFSTNDKRLRWIEMVQGYQPIGPIESTWVDVEREIMSWLAVNHKIQDSLRIALNEEIENWERAELARLTEKYGSPSD